jgi:hypothetical protein
MSDLAAFQSFWILAPNTLLHELGFPLPVMPTAFVLGACQARRYIASAPSLFLGAPACRGP